VVSVFLGFSWAFAALACALCVNLISTLEKQNPNRKERQEFHPRVAKKQVETSTISAVRLVAVDGLAWLSATTYLGPWIRESTCVFGRWLQRKMRVVEPHSRSKSASLK
jgi:hypothetical protein